MNKPQKGGENKTLDQEEITHFWYPIKNRQLVFHKNDRQGNKSTHCNINTTHKISHHNSGVTPSILGWSRHSTRHPLPGCPVKSDPWPYNYRWGESRYRVIILPNHLVKTELHNRWKVYNVCLAHCRVSREWKVVVITYISKNCISTTEKWDISLMSISYTLFMRMI